MHIKTLLLLSGLLVACQDAVVPEQPRNPVPEEKKYVVEATLLQEVSAETLKLMASALGQAEVAALLTYDVRSFLLTYETTYKGEPIEASGVIMIPKNPVTEAPIISLQHGTTFVKADAPSADKEFKGVELFAAAGYIAVMPDFIGYGKSENIFHPYYDQPHSASVVIDMIHAAREFAEDHQKIAVGDNLFLAGYSEGGFVTLAAAREIENNPIHGLNVTAVAAGAGGYDLSEMLKGIIATSHYAYPAYLTFVLMSYNETYDWNKPLSYFFQPLYAEALSKYMTGHYSGSYINSKLTTHVPSLLNPEFLERLKTTEGETELKTALSENSVAGWKSAIPIRLFHGTADEIMPYQNSQVTLEKFKAAGSADVTLNLIPGGTHGSSFVPMLQDFIPWFLSFKNPG